MPAFWAAVPVELQSCSSSRPQQQTRCITQTRPGGCGLHTCEVGELVLKLVGRYLREEAGVLLYYLTDSAVQFGVPAAPRRLLSSCRSQSDPHVLEMESRKEGRKRGGCGSDRPTEAPRSCFYRSPTPAQPLSLNTGCAPA